MLDTYLISSPGILGIRTNVADLKWSWGVNAPISGREDYEACAVRLSFQVGDLSENEAESRSNREQSAYDGKYHYFRGRERGDSLYYSRPLIGNTKLQLRVSELIQGTPKLHVSRSYQRFVTHRFMNLHSPGYILSDLASLMLLRQGYSPLHCSAIRTGDATVLILAAPNTGKTLAAMTACLNFGAQFIAEDLAITDGRTLYSVPWTSTFRYYDEIDSSMRSRLVNQATRVLPPLELVALTKSRRIDSLISPNLLLDRSDITHVVILERGREQVQRERPEEALRKASNLNRYEFNYMKAPALVAYEFFNPELDLLAAMEEERRILASVIGNASEILVIRSNDASRYAQILLDYVDQGRRRS